MYIVIPRPTTVQLNKRTQLYQDRILKSLHVTIQRQEKRTEERK
jgi:hypothetical protein